MLNAWLSGQDPEKIIKGHINRLHRYNEIKDGTQSLIATVSGVNLPCFLPDDRHRLRPSVSSDVVLTTLNDRGYFLEIG